MLKVITVRFTHYGFLVVILACILKFLKRVHFRKLLTESDGVTNFSQKNFEK